LEGRFFGAMNPLPAPVAKAARALLEISQEELAKAAGVSVKTVINLESGGNVMSGNVAKILAEFAKRGIVFTGEAGQSPDGVRRPR